MDAVALRKSGLTSFTFDYGSQQANNVILVKLLARPMRRLALCHGAPSRQGSRSANWMSEDPPSPASHGPDAVQHHGKAPPLAQDSILQIGALIRVKHAVIAQGCVKGRGCNECAEEPVGLRRPQKDEPQPLVQPGFDAGGL
jgi:hypothetical protein